MKNLFNFKSLLLVVLSVLVFSSCNDKSQDISPLNQENNDVAIVETPSKSDSTRSRLAASTDPTISSITASLGGGGKFFTKDVDYTKYLQANNTATSTVTIKGTNFGSTAGTVSVGGGYSVTNIKWSPTVITGTLNCIASSVAGNITFSVTPKGSTKPVYWAALLCPYLNTRRYGQCTFDCTSQRILRGLSVPSPAYQQTAAISGTFLAQSGDILHWSGSHQATITGVTQDTKNKNLYTFSLREMDGTVGNGTVLSYSFSIEFNRDAKGNITSRKSGNYYSSLYKSTAASSYYR
jgi:hypothetical protein